MNPVCGGVGVINPQVSQPGTVGLVVRRGPQSYILSCYHVLCRPARASYIPGEPILLTASSDTVAYVETGLPELDVAVARIADGVAVGGGILGLPALASPVEPVEGMRVVKQGSATGRTAGQIARIDGDDIWIEARDTNDLICGGGDSGAVWVVEDGWAPVVLHTGVNDTGLISYARGIRLTRVFAALDLSMVAADATIQS